MTTPERVGVGGLRRRLADSTEQLRSLTPARGGVLLAGGGLIAAFAIVAHDIADITGQTGQLYPGVLGAVLAATVLSRLVSVRTGLIVALAAFGLGALWYLAALSYVPSVPGVLASNVELLTGRTLLRMDAVGRWVVVATPTLAFVTWFLVLCRRYVAGASVGAGAVGYLVLTGDAGTVVTLLGVVSTVGVIGGGDLERYGGSAPGIERLVLVLAVMVIAPVLVTVVPGGSASPVSLTGDAQPSMESAVVTQDELEIVGAVDQSPQIRFRVAGDEPRRWRTAAFDRYTGDGWVRTGDRSTAGLTAPPGETRTRTYEYSLESPFGAVPTAWQPTGVMNLSSPALRTSAGGLQVDGQLPAGEQYTVTAAVPNASQTALETAGRAYPAGIAEAYTQLPDSTPDRVAARTNRITQQATNPYETAVVIEEWLETNREYSLAVSRPEGDIADAFLFEMEAGYCTYHATTMVAMLRSQEIPARLAVGYTPGEPVGNDQWVVRGVNSHAWVEVYFPEVGWVEFDPTPAAPRETTEQARVDEAVAAGEATVGPEAVDDGAASADAVGGSEGQFGENRTTGINNSSETARENVERLSEVRPAEIGAVGNQTPTPGTVTEQTVTETDTETGIVPGPFAKPLQRQLALWAVVLGGVVAGVRRSRIHTRLAWAVRLRVQPRSGDPAVDIERAHDQLLYVLQRRYRQRRPGETMRAYVADIGAGSNARRIVRLRERARYGDETALTDRHADDAFECLDWIRRTDAPADQHARRSGRDRSR